MDITEWERENDLKELLEQLLTTDHISHPVAVGVTKQIIGKGMKSLSDSQKQVYQDRIEPIFNNRDVKCRRCLTTIEDLPLNERYYLLDEGYCPFCGYQMTKDD